MKVKLLCFLLAVSSTAMASEYEPRWEGGNAVNNCRAALTSYDQGVRSRPLALVNEGENQTFINCAYRTDVKRRVYEFGAMLQNYTNQDMTIKCTGVFGADNGQGFYWVKNVDVDAGERSYIRWKDSNGFEGNVGFQCRLPGGTGLNEILLLQ